MKQSDQPARNYRVSVKAVIRDDKGRLLLNHEAGHEGFSLPGGGIEHGETVSHALKRELSEELGFTSDFEFAPVCTLPYFAEYSQRWLMWSVYEITVDDASFCVGEDSQEIKWFYPSDIESETRAGKLIQEVLKFL